MRIPTFILLLCILLFFSACKKKEELGAEYPAVYEFTQEGAEVSTLGMVKSPFSDRFVIQNIEENTWSKKPVLHVLDLKNSINGNIIVESEPITYYSGMFTVSGGISQIGKGDEYCGISAAFNVATNTTSAFLQKKQLSNTSSQYGSIHEPNVVVSTIKSVSGGNYLVIGAKINGNDKNVIVIKYNNSFTKVWEKEFGGAGEDMAIDAVQLCDDNYGILAYTYSKGAGDRDIWFLKLDANGYLKWDYTYGGAGYEEPQQIVSRTGCDIYVAGHSSSFGAPEHDGYILKINENGNKIWEKTFGTPNHDGFNAVTHIPDTKTFIAAGRKHARYWATRRYFYCMF